MNRSGSLKIVTIVGARPQFIKVKPLVSAVAAHNERTKTIGRPIHQVCVHTGQHYDYEMSKIFFDDLALPKPDYNLDVGSGKHGWQTSEILKKTEDVLIEEKPDVVVVFGDTNSTLAGALAASKLNMPLAHVEAGLRSFNRRMPEEINRIVTDHLSTFLFAPSESAVKNLCDEGIKRGVFSVGDVMYETAMEFAKVAEAKSTVIRRLGLVPREYVLATIHRAENTENEQSLRNIVGALIEISKRESVIWPIHPRTRGCLDKFHLFPGAKDSQHLRLIDPVSYLDMLQLERCARIVFTDSGGVQKETCWFQVPCITLRQETEWIETVQEGRNRLVGTEKQSILDACNHPAPPESRVIASSEQMHAATKIVEVLSSEL